LRLAFASLVPLDPSRPPLRQRAASLALALAVTLLLIVGLLTLNGSVPQLPQFKGGPVLIDLAPEKERADATRTPARAKPKPAPERPAPPPEAIPVPEVPPPPMPTRSYYIHLTPEENEQADISKHPRVPMRSPGSGEQGTQQASTAGDSQPVGTAPNGEPLYNAEWYRRPTDAELRTYLPPHMPRSGWGLVACKTIANHHVDDCVELGNSPPGSHLAGAVRQAAWQFLVRAPRRGGRELVGTWVRILIEYSQKGDKRGDEPETPDGDPAPGG
jgi:periplasmic protein TonB